METIKSNYDILLVDHDVDEHFRLESTLSKLGSNKNLISVETGEEAIEYLNAISRQDFPSLIILDFYMPFMSGKAILKYLKTTYRYSRIPVIVHSSEMTENMKYDLLELGAVAGFRKSPDRKEFRF